MWLAFTNQLEHVPMENWANDTNGLFSIRRGKFSSSLICWSPPTHSLGSHDDSQSNSSATHHLFTEQVESVDRGRTRTVFGTDEPNRPSRSYSFLGQISHQIASTQHPTYQLKAVSWQQISSEVICWWAYHGRWHQELCKIQVPLHLFHPSDLPGLLVCFRRKLDGSDKTALHKAMLIITWDSAIVWVFANWFFDDLF